MYDIIYGISVFLKQDTHMFIASFTVPASPIENLSEQEKASIREQINQLRPMCERLDQLLPIFLAVTANGEATKRLILMKHMFQDQLEMLPQNKYVISLEHMQKLKEHFTRYFTWIKNAMGSANQQQGQQAQPQAQQQAQQQGQQQGQQPGVTNTANATMNANIGKIGGTSPVSPQLASQAQNVNRSMPNSAKVLPTQNVVTGLQQMQPQQQPVHGQQQPMPQQQQMPGGVNAAAAVHSGLGLKHANIDLKLPPSKRQKGVESPVAAPQPQPQQQSPATAATQASPAAVPASASPQGDQLDSASQPDAANAARPANTQLIIQAAIAAGYSPQIVVRLPQKALQANWLLQKAAQGKAPITAAQQQQIQQMLNGMVEQVKQQLASETNNAQALAQAHVSAAANHQTAANRQPATPSKVIDLESSTNNVASTTTLETLPIADIPNSSVGLQDSMKAEPDSSVSAMAYSLPAQLSSSQAVVDTKIMTSSGTPISTIPADSFSTIRPGMTSDGRVVNANLFAADIIKDLVGLLARPEKDQNVVGSTPQKVEIYESVEDSKGGVMFEMTTKEVSTKENLFAPFSEDLTSQVNQYEGFKESVSSGGNTPSSQSNWYSIGMDPQIPDVSEYLHGFDILECN